MDPLLLLVLPIIMGMEIIAVMYASMKTFLKPGLGPGGRLEMLLGEKLLMINQEVQ